MLVRSQLLAICLILIANFISFMESISHGGVYWVRYNPTNEDLPTDAIVGGHDYETLYIARAAHKGSLTPGKYVPSIREAIISWGGSSVEKSEFEILCGYQYEYRWVRTTTDNFPHGAVIGGYERNTYEQLYVGRVYYSGQLIPGKVARSQGVCYFAYEDRELHAKYFEVLVARRNNNGDPYWIHYNPHNSDLPNDAIVGGHDHETQSVMESISHGGVYWVRYNPTNEDLPTDAIVGGHDYETLYIARAAHKGSLTPGKYVPSIREAIISWGGSSVEKSEFEILCGYQYEYRWVRTTTDNFPHGAVIGGYERNTYEQLYVGRVYYSGQLIPGKVARSQGVCYFAYEDRELHAKYFEVLVARRNNNGDPYWIHYNPHNSDLPNDAIVGGHDHETLYIARAPYEGSLTPGKYVPSIGKAIISWGWSSHVQSRFEILCGRNYRWFQTTTANIPYGAVIGGYIQNSYEPLYVGRARYSGQIIPGKVARSDGVLFFAYGSRELSVDNFEILVVARRQIPKIRSNTNETATIGETVTIECKVLEGVPKPTVTWEFRPTENSKYVSLNGSDNVLRISKVDVKDAGIYKCIATNDLGSAQNFTRLTVLSEDSTSDETLHWVKNNPDTNVPPAHAVIGG